MRCNNPIGFVKGNKKGYCKNRGIVATFERVGRGQLNLCQRCLDARNKK